MFEKSEFPKETKLCMWAGKSNKRALKESLRNQGERFFSISHQNKFQIDHAETLISGKNVPNDQRIISYQVDYQIHPTNKWKAEKTF